MNEQLDTEKTVTTIITIDARAPTAVLTSWSSLPDLPKAKHESLNRKAISSSTLTISWNSARLAAGHEENAVGSFSVDRPS